MLNVYCPGCSFSGYWEGQCQVNFIIMLAIYTCLLCGYQPIPLDLVDAKDTCKLKGSKHWYQCPQCKGEGLVKGKVCSMCEGEEEVH